MCHARRVLAAFCTALILGCGALVASAPAAFAATCKGTGCNGSDPYSTGCAGTGASYYVAATTPLIKDSTGVRSNSYGYIQLWWSNTCSTNWTRMVVNVSGATGGEVVVSTSNGDCPSEISGAKGVYLSCQLYAPGIPAAAGGFLYSNSGAELYHANLAQ